jgi:hypothetical protein
MQLVAGYRFRMAPRFATGLSWNERLQLNGGVIRSGDGFRAEPAWRPANDSERALLLADDQPAGSEKAAADPWQTDVCLWTIPEHLRAKWWDLAARQVETLPSGLEGMAGFARAVADFAQFKGVPLPAECTFDVTLASRDDRADSTTGETAEDSARRFLWRGSQAADAAASSRVIARINLGDQQTSLIFLNLRPQQITEMLASRPANAALAVQDENPVSLFLQSFSTYPLVRLILAPGEGIWLPGANVVYEADCPTTSEIDVWLNLRQVAT